jgi:hypothetical protein
MEEVTQFFDELFVKGGITASDNDALKKTLAEDFNSPPAIHIPGPVTLKRKRSTSLRQSALCSRQRSYWNAS